MKKIINFIKENIMLIFILIVVIVFLIGRMVYSKLNNKLEINDIEVVEKQKYEANEFFPIRSERVDLYTAYINYFIKLYKEDSEKAFLLLTDACREKFDNDSNNFKKYVEKNKILEFKNIMKYGEKNSNRYVIYDNLNNAYYINENGTWNFKLDI